jgi:hypothetical protein
MKYDIGNTGQQKENECGAVCVPCKTKKQEQYLNVRSAI